MRSDLTGARLFVRPACRDDVDAMGRVTVDTMRASFRGMQPDTGYLAPDRTLPELYAESARNWRLALGEAAAEPEEDERIFVAEDESGITGVCMAGPRRLPAGTFAPFRGEVYILLVRPDRQRLGYGRALVGVALAFLSERRLTPVAVESLAANAPARAFYERLGATLAGEHTWEEDGTPLQSVVYGWQREAHLVTEVDHGR